MEISPYSQLLMLTAALLGGLLLGALWDVGTALRIVLGAYSPPAYMQSCYERPLPFLGRSVPFHRQNRLYRLWRGTVVGVGDFFYCLGLAFFTEWVLYRFNSGVFRAAVPLLVLLGLGLWRVTAARLLGAVIARLAYGISAALLYLRALCLLPPRVLRYLVLRFVYRPARAYCERRKATKRRRVSEALGRMQLAAAAEGFEENGGGDANTPASEEHIKKEKEKSHGQEKQRGKISRAHMDHSHTHHSHFHPFRRHHCQPSGGMEPKARGKGAAGGSA